MSHSKERKEKICLNCNAELTGRFCHICGQENLEPKESVWGLISHFFYDITHFDGKFFSTVGYLVAKPGFLSKEYIRGRRASYLNPIRMYVFSASLFFLIFFSMYNPRQWNLDRVNKRDKKDIASVTEIGKREALKNAKTRADSIRLERYFNALETDDPDNKNKEDSSGNQNRGWNVNFSDVDYDTKAAYDSAEKMKPPGERDGWFSRSLNYRFIEVKGKYEGRGDEFVKDLLDKFIHTFPYLLFVSLPLYALFLKLLYIRRKQFLYVSHGMFLIHLYIFTFIILLIFFALSKLSSATGWGWIDVLQVALFIYGVWYTVRAMRNFYGQGWGKTIMKFILLNILAFFSLVFLFAGFFLFAAFRI